MLNLHYCTFLYQLRSSFHSSLTNFHTHRDDHAHTCKITYTHKNNERSSSVYQHFTQYINKFFSKKRNFDIMYPRKNNHNTFCTPVQMWVIPVKSSFFEFSITKIKLVTYVTNRRWATQTYCPSLKQMNLHVLKTYFQQTQLLKLVLQTTIRVLLITTDLEALKECRICGFF